MEDLDRRLLLLGAGLAGVGIAATASAGPLNPPGAPASTPGPEPRIPIPAGPAFVIPSNGSYYLTGSVAGLSFANSGISASIDLNGYALDTNSTLNALPGLAGNRVRLFNGTVRNTGNTLLTVGDNSILTDLILLGGSVNLGAKSLMQRCVLDGTNMAVTTGADCIIDRCTITSSPSTAIVVNLGASSQITGCAVRGGVTGISVGNGTATTSYGAMVRDCSIKNAGTTGIQVTSGAVMILNNSIASCPNGIVFNSTIPGTRVEGNSLLLGTNGINMQGNVGLIVRNSIYSYSNPFQNITNAQVGAQIDTGTKTLTDTASPWANLIT